jgi:hypothetical protein
MPVSGGQKNQAATKATFRGSLKEGWFRNPVGTVWPRVGARACVAQPVKLVFLQMVGTSLLESICYNFAECAKDQKYYFCTAATT